MKATIKLQEVTKLQLGTDLAKLTLILESSLDGCLNQSQSKIKSFV
jgi:hypothetical protein